MQVERGGDSIFNFKRGGGDDSIFKFKVTTIFLPGLVGESRCNRG